MDWLQRLLDWIREIYRRRSLVPRPSYEWRPSDLAQKVSAPSLTPTYYTDFGKELSPDPDDYCTYPLEYTEALERWHPKNAPVKARWTPESWTRHMISKLEEEGIV